MTKLAMQWEILPANSLRTTPTLSLDWSRLNTERGNLPFLDTAAVTAAHEIFGDGTEKLMVGRVAGQVQAMFILARTGRLGWTTFQPSQIPLGLWVASRDYTLDDLTSSLITGPLRGSLVLSITQIDPLLTHRPTETESSRTANYIDTGVVEISGSYEDYWNARGKNLRQNMRKQRKKLETDGIQTVTRKITAAADMVDVIQRYGQIESAGWKASAGTAIRLDNDQGHFYLALMQNAANAGEAVAYEFLFDDRSVALNLCLQRDSTFTILKTTYDESTHPYSPAFLLLQDELEEMFGAGKIKRIEFYGRMMEWHTRWTESQRTLFHFTQYRWPWVKKFAGMLQEARARRAGRLAQQTTQNTTQSTVISDKAEQDT